MTATEEEDEEIARIAGSPQFPTEHSQRIPEQIVASKSPLLRRKKEINRGSSVRAAERCYEPCKGPGWLHSCLSISRVGETGRRGRLDDGREDEEWSRWSALA